MKVMRVTDFHSTQAAINRDLFQLLEHFPTFCLIECKRQNVIQVPLECQVLVLDNLGLARDPETILDSVFERFGNRDVLIVVDHQPDNGLLASSGLRPVVHLILGPASQVHHRPHANHPDVPTTTSINTAIACLEQSLAA